MSSQITSATSAQRPGEAAWSVDQIQYDTLDCERIRDDTVLFYMVSTASLVEFASRLYAQSLAEFFHDDDEILNWLTRSWEREELQHGEALKRYVQAAWPDLDWEAAYEGFIGELTRSYSVNCLAPTRALEMVARCVVESGTATFYRMISTLATEPILKQVAGNISTDEVRHYKHFYRYYLRYSEVKKPGRLAVLRTLHARSSEIDSEDVVYAVKHILRVHSPKVRWQRSEYEAVRDASLRLARPHFPYAMATKMLLKPLRLSAPTARVVMPVAASAARLLFMR